MACANHIVYCLYFKSSTLSINTVFCKFSFDSLTASYLFKMNFKHFHPHYPLSSPLLLSLKSFSFPMSTPPSSSPACVCGPRSLPSWPECAWVGGYLQKQRQFVSDQTHPSTDAINSKEYPRYRQGLMSPSPSHDEILRGPVLCVEAQLIKAWDQKLGPT